MTVGNSLFLIALGAVLRFAVNVTLGGFDMHTFAVVLMIVGFVGLVVSVLWMTRWADRRGNPVAFERDIRLRELR